MATVKSDLIDYTNIIEADLYSFNTVDTMQLQSMTDTPISFPEGLLDGAYLTSTQAVDLTDITTQLVADTVLVNSSGVSMIDATILSDISVQVSEGLLDGAVPPTIINVIPADDVPIPLSTGNTSQIVQIDDIVHVDVAGIKYKKS